jgi:hypothetical protein
MATWTLIDEQHVRTVELDDALVLDPRELGWEPKPEGLCRDEVCIPVDDAASLDVAGLGRALGRPVVLDADERVVAFAASPAQRALALTGSEAPDFELPDLAGVRHRLSSFRGRKVVLYAYASW